MAMGDIRVAQFRKCALSKAVLLLTNNLPNGESIDIASSLNEYATKTKTSSCNEIIQNNNQKSLWHTPHFTNIIDILGEKKANGSCIAI